MKAGVVDPTKVVRLELENSSSIAGLLITTEAAVADALAQLLARRIVVELNGLQIAEGKADLLAFQAGPVEQHLNPMA